jgi:DNA-directed RNA polymerase subunit RPC12/RpoP
MFHIKCDYCGQKTPIKSIEQFKDLQNEKSDAKFTLSDKGIRCRKCGNKVVSRDEAN